MAITKLRLQQIQDEAADFANASYDAAPETLQDIMKNLAHNLGQRFGTVDVSDKNYWKEQATAGVLASRNDASELLIKQAGAANIKIEGAQQIQALATGHLTASSAANVHLNAGADLEEMVAGNNTRVITGNVDESAANKIGSYTGAMTLDAVSASHVKVSGGALVLSSSAQASLEGATLLLDSEGAAVFDIEGALTETAASLSAVYEGASEMKTNAGDMKIIAAAGLSGSGLTMKLEATQQMELDAGYVGIASASDVEVAAVNHTETLSGDFVVDGVAFDADFTAASHLIAAGVGATMEVAGASLELSASADFIRLDDAFRGAASLDAYYSNGIKLADGSADWTSFQDAFGNKSILKAISEAAAGSASAVRAVFKMTAAASLDGVTNDVKIFSRYGSIATTYGPSTWTSANEEYPAGTDYTADELDFGTEVYVNGQRLAQSEDFTIDFDAGTGAMDVSIKFALEADDVVEVVIK